MNSMIQTVDLTKKFNDFVANDHINLDVKEQVKTVQENLQ